MHVTATATADHIKILFHWPKKSALVAIGQNIPKGITHAVAKKTLSRFLKLARKHAQIIAQINTLPKIIPITPVSQAIGCNSYVGDYLVAYMAHLSTNYAIKPGNFRALSQNNKLSCAIKNPLFTVCSRHLFQNL